MNNDQNSNKPHSAEKREASVRKHEILSENLDRIADDLIILFEEIHGFKLTKTDRQYFHTKSKGVLYYWLGLVYDDAVMEVKNLELALETSRSISQKLRESHKDLQAIISSSQNPQIIEEKIEDPKSSKQDLSDKIDGFYSGVNKVFAKNP